MAGSDFDFVFRWIPNTYQARVQRAAVLYPAMGIAHTPRAINQKTRSLIRVWRARVALLVDAGWLPRSDRRGIVYARNCSPAFVYTAPASRPCSLRAICPFCYARWVRDVWLKVDGLFPYRRRAAGTHAYLTPQQTADTLAAMNDVPREHAPAVSDDYMDGRLLRSIILSDVAADEDVPATSFPFQLVEVHSREWVPFQRHDLDAYALCRQLLEELVAMRARRMRRIRALGSFVTTTVVPVAGGWRIKQRELHQVEPGYTVPAPATSRVVRYKRPTRRDVFHAVTHVCRYPRELLYGDVDKTSLLLACRQGSRTADAEVPAIRLSAMYGTLRVRS